ncbi:MAG: hypothetical protein COZ37_02525 [bacterium (Candidatus Ratteibacteria) CG_4_10_14_3_um_filter_41_18]|uniref:Polymerase beta nucleotidyltransferase domain-containing protein n=4 Tax=Candidatus Ratteibacteria TaxID=2979319 RepID=A0A2M7E7N3_9BACT|nr:MAG: hypothetical protein COS11_05815 [bacterium (Candidatus Ratteibacteria) CG01_land_8_20_14_3_00_40_19]PIW32644.1 MAG: hypothetical protein COW28_05565 [bacterium (Candidatus Ratteibacteria) CG15_BIG_FIL_POST_REV_8_21_14_020_41_12]PIX77476.1 MAG: hypothetical protein COZ37_02525 [bacterium (Candidatus Ratteibacteria) CG_4_10_14_3_um_filter_41_18]HCG77210.1 hypothetical protein [bacterium]
MVKKEIIEKVKEFVFLLENREKIKIDKVILYGSCLRGGIRADSDIDVAIISSQFGKDRIEEGAKLFEIAGEVDPKIEPIPISTKAWREDTWIPLIFEVKSKGIEIKQKKGEQRKRLLQKELKRITDIVIKRYLPDKIILFGSLANGKVQEWSDIDLVVIKETKVRFIKRMQEVGLMTSPRLGVDFIVYTPEEFENMIKDDNYFIKDEILRKGRVLYDKQLV